MSDPLSAFPAFAERVRARLEAGRAYETTNPAVERPTLDLIREIQEELEDVCGWSCALWAKLEALKARAAKVDEPAEIAATKADAVGPACTRCGAEPGEYCHEWCAHRQTVADDAEAEARPVRGDW